MRKVTISVLVACLLLAALPLALDAQTTYQRFENLWARTLRSTGNTTVGEDLTVTDDTTVLGTLTLGGGANVSGLSTFDGDVVANGYIASTDMLYLIPADPITVTNGGTITPTGAFVELTAAGAVGADLAACGDGQVTVILNTANQTITITDTGATRLSGNAVLGQWDTLTVIGSGVSCNEIAQTDN